MIREIKEAAWWINEMKDILTSFSLLINIFIIIISRLTTFSATVTAARINFYGLGSFNKNGGHNKKCIKV